MIKNVRGHWVDHTELYTLLGLNPKQHLPKEGFEKALRVGQRVVEFRCIPANGPERQRAGKAQRITFLCDCGCWIPFGRAGQHLRACKSYQAIEG